MQGMSRVAGSVERGHAPCRVRAWLLALGLIVAVLACSMRVGTAAAADPTQGPGGPILVISSSSNPFSTYYAEILRAEGLNEFTRTDISNLTQSALAAHDVAILGD